MARYTVAPTKTNLLRLRTEYSFAREGHELLDQKKDILTTELLALVDRARAAERQMDELLAAAFQALRMAIVRGGRNEVAETAAAVSVKSSISVSTRRVMGVTLPEVEISVGPLSPAFSPGETSFWVDEASLRFAAALKALGNLVETKVSLRRLAKEVKKTMRRVNALEKIALPDLEESVKYITDALEESERETFFTMKLVKNRLTQRRAESGR
jgi:V/A-type H+-transporting ATPase subunit D